MTVDEADALELLKLDAPQPTARPRYSDGRRFHPGDRVQMRNSASMLRPSKPIGRPRIGTFGEVVGPIPGRAFEVRVLLDDYSNVGTYFEEQFDHEDGA